MSHGDPIAAWLLEQGLDPMRLMFAVVCATVMTAGIRLIPWLRSRP